MQNYLTYLQSSLGLDHVIMPEKTARVHIQSVSEKPLTPEAQEMFDKIIAALKMPPASYVVSFVSEPAEYEAPLVVLFTDESTHRGEWYQEANARVLRTHSLASMVQDPGLKKQCWMHLQTIPK